MICATIIRNSSNIIFFFSDIFIKNNPIHSRTTRYAWIGNKLFAFSIALLILITQNMGSLFSQGVIIDDEKLENWSDHAKLDSKKVVKGDYSIKWENISENETMTCYAVPDTMGFKNTLSFWMYCDNPTQAQVSVFLQTSDNEDITTYPNDGYWVWFKLDWHGWKKWEFTGSHFHPAKAATYSHDSYHTIIKDVKMLRFDTDNDAGYGTMGRISWTEGKTANADGRRENLTLYIDDIRWNNEPVWKQVKRPHPGGLITGEMISNAREGYKSGNSSYISAIEDLGKYASRSYSKSINFPQFASDCGIPDSYGYNIRVEFGDNEHIAMLGNDAENALRCAMAYALDLDDPFPNTNITRDEFRDKALDILNQWALVRKYSGYNEDDNPAGGLILSSRGSKLFLAAELMWNCPEWTQAEKDRFLYFATEAAWHTLSTVIYRSMSNWGWQAIYTQFLINHLADRSHEYDLMHFKNLLNIAISGPLNGLSFEGGQDKIFNAGGLPKEIERGFQSIHYTGWALRGGAGACEILAHDMGLNMYEWISLNGQGSLKNALVDFYWQYGKNNDSQHTWINHPETQSVNHLEYDLVEGMGYIFENQNMLDYNSYTMALGGLGFLGVHVFRPPSLTSQSLIIPDSNHATIKVPYIQYKLTTACENGSISPSSGTYTNGTEIELQTLPDEGYMFTGWSGDISGTTNPISIRMDSSITVTANFVQGFNLVIHASNGTVEPSEGTFLEGSEVTLTANPDNDFHFEKWSGDVTGTENPLTFIMDSDKEITAHFYQTYQLNITAENGTVEPGSGEYKANTQLELEATPDEGYKFLAWNGPVSGILNPITFTLNRDMDIIAIFQALEEYSLTIRTDNGTVTPQSGTYYEGDTVRLAVKADSGYVFSNWSGDVQDTSETIEIIMNRNYTMEANFTKITSVWSDIKGNSPEVYPNPVNDKLRIEMTTQADIHEPCQLTLYDVLGKIKFSQNIYGSSVIDVSDLKDGVYILSISKDSRKILNRRVIKK